MKQVLQPIFLIFLELVPFFETYLDKICVNIQYVQILVKYVHISIFSTNIILSILTKNT